MLKSSLFFKTFTNEAVLSAAFPFKTDRIGLKGLFKLNGTDLFHFRLSTDQTAKIAERFYSADPRAAPSSGLRSTFSGLSKVSASSHGGQLIMDVNEQNR